MQDFCFRRLPLVALLSASLAVFGGCLDILGSDDPADTVATVEEIVDEISDGVASTAVEMSAEDVEALLDWAENGIQSTSGRDVSRTWNDEQQAWIIEGTDLYEEEDASGNIEFSYWVQFLAAGTPQQQVDDFTDRIEVSRDARNRGNYHPADRGFDIDYDWSAANELVATRDESTGWVSLIGAGSMEGTTEAHAGARVFEHAQNAVWQSELGFDPESSACPAGTVTGRVNDTFDVVAQHDGQGNVAWTLSHDGTVLRSDTRTVRCGPTGSGE